MKNITHLLCDVYTPQKAILIYSNLSDPQNRIYVEAFDVDDNGKPINAHPLSEKECKSLSKMLDVSGERERKFLQCRNILPENVLFVNAHCDGFAIWYTPEKKVNLFFKDNLKIPSGKARVPTLVWKATRNHLQVYALRENKRPVEDTLLYYAPFFNLYENGNVCMGTVNIEMEKNCCLEDFIQQWEQYFWNSYFSHLLDDHCPVSVNIVQLWQEQVSTNKKFPVEVLIKRKEKLKNLCNEKSR